MPLSQSRAVRRFTPTVVAAARRLTPAARSWSYSARRGWPARARLDVSPAALAHAKAVFRLMSNSRADSVTLPVRSNDNKNAAFAADQRSGPWS